MSQNEFICAFCGSNGILSRDHIPPKGLFPSPRPSNLITVKACMQCNNGTKKDDQYFVNILSLDARSDEGASRGVALKSIRGLNDERAKKYRDSIVDNPTLVNIQVPTGEIIQNAIQLECSHSRLIRTVDKIARGLAFMYSGTVIDGDYKVSSRFFYSYDELDWVPAVIWNYGLNNPDYSGERGDNVFKYYGNVLPENMWVWIFEFYKHHHAVSFIINERSSAVQKYSRTKAEDFFSVKDAMRK